jgi:hypothetical protein
LGGRKRYCNGVLDCREDGLYFCFTSLKIIVLTPQPQRS